VHERIRTLSQAPSANGPIVYWMIRDQRAHDNWALLYAQEIALQNKQPLHVVFCCRRDLGQHFGTVRMFDWMLAGLAEVAAELHTHNIAFTFLLGDPVSQVEKFCQQIGAGELIVDFFPLRIYTEWQNKLAQRLTVRVTQVDTHNIVPCWIASPKQEFAARTIRPKIHKLLGKYLVDFPKLLQHPISTSLPKNNWKEIRKSVQVDTSVPSITWIKPGEKAALAVLEHFAATKLASYAAERNDPTKRALSDLSPYLHFGQIAAQRVALTTTSTNHNPKSNESFLEELIIRKELADNYCFYNQSYDSFAGFPRWAQQTLTQHKQDQRTVHYTLEELEKAMTHDHIWNAAQNEMVTTGKMHGYLRMYWAKKILEWTSTPEEAQRFAIYLNDRYSLDGRDPNGYVGIAWSIGGLHDRPWFERPIFGTVRYMSAGGLEKKFNTALYAAQWKNRVST
jgi:deoxyribodipyrimidine photo-lyase